MPMAISFVGAGVIWKFIYSYKGTGSGIQEIGLLNAIVIALGGTLSSLAAASALEQLFLDRHHGLAANRLCHGHPFLGDQRRSRLI